MVTYWFSYCLSVTVALVSRKLIVLPSAMSTWSVSERFLPLSCSLINSTTSSMPTPVLAEMGMASGYSCWMSRSSAFECRRSVLLSRSRRFESLAPTASSTFCTVSSCCLALGCEMSRTMSNKSA